MNKEMAKELLNNQKSQLQKNLKKYQKAEKGIGKEEFGSTVLGPRDDLEYQRMVKDIKESGDDEE